VLLKQLRGFLPVSRQAASSYAVSTRSYLRFTPAFYVVFGLATVISFGSCRSLKKTPAPSQTRQDSTLSDADTSQSEISRTFDSLTNSVSNQVTDLWNNLWGIEDSGRSVLTPPSMEDRNPMVGDKNFETPDGFLDDPIERRIEFDSAGNIVERDVFLGGDVGSPNVMSFDDYVRLQKQRSINRGLRETALGYTPGDTSSAAAAQQGWFDDYTQVSIPIPPILPPGIFGEPKINLRVNGDVAVHLAYRDNQFLATTGALFSGSETGLDFRQEINLSTKGTIGDKLNIGADWGSGRSFQFENLLKLGYKGYPEEIIQSIEAGNVSLTTPSQYIGTQQALRHSFRTSICNPPCGAEEGRPSNKIIRWRIGWLSNRGDHPACELPPQFVLPRYVVHPELRAVLLDHYTERE
jgi:hypothetical protein